MVQETCPAKTFAILEGRDVIGGTWDLFRYPGVRSDSDMYTMGYDSKPWREPWNQREPSARHSQCAIWRSRQTLKP